ncbi:hypothetical protein KOR42_18760 [Thalassoglobus neptunius]|uniref:Uncharacterized protein n=1 Tax=Thalassoglobus neptunius TaxID=1938619 RepID=A0A5C5X837_9PLAN|nr:hypothetical protein KOR42_18760 [Thalassoglobus neptunius]
MPSPNLMPFDEGKAKPDESRRIGTRTNEHQVTERKEFIGCVDSLHREAG